jgi:PIN domain nuclease of toxin-antitoxin system
MTHLLDTHVWIQRALGEPLPPLVIKALTENAWALAISDISIWEASRLLHKERVKVSGGSAEFFRLALTPELTVLPITSAIGRRSVTLEDDGFHKDPADQLIVATALEHGLRLISNDSRIRLWGRVPLLWQTSRG